MFLKLKESPNFFFILLSLILFLACLYLYFDNKKLKEKILKLELETKEILERKILKSASFDENNNDLVSIANISVETNVPSFAKKGAAQLVDENTYLKESTVVSKEMNMQQKAVERNQKVAESPQMNKGTTFSDNRGNRGEFVARTSSVSDNIPREGQTLVDSSSKNNVQMMEKDGSVASQMTLSDLSNSAVDGKFDLKKGMDSRKEMSSESILSNEVFSMDRFSFDLNEFVKKSDKRVPNIKNDMNNMEYLREVSNQMANEIKPQTIELTDYEKEQEDHAIISYQELLALRDKLEFLSESDRNKNLIEDLKRIRNTLN